MPPKSANARYTSLRISAEAMRLRDQLAAKRGISKAAVVEWAIRKLAEVEGVTVDQR